MTRTFWLLPLIAALGCASQPRPDTVGADRTTGASGDTLLVFERTICFGTCPAYRVMLAPDGALTYEGMDHVATKGVVRDQLPPDQVEAVRQAIIDARFFEIPVPLKCREEWTDHPAAYVTARIDGRTQRIDHDLGCKGFNGEDRLLTLEDRLDSLLGTARWVGKRTP